MQPSPITAYRHAKPSFGGQDTATRGLPAASHDGIAQNSKENHVDVCLGQRVVLRRVSDDRSVGLGGSARTTASRRHLPQRRGFGGIAAPRA